MSAVDCGGCAPPVQVADAAPVEVLADGLTQRQREMLRDVARDGGFDFLDPTDYHSSGSLAFYNRDRVIDALQRKGLLDGDKLTDLGRAALARVGGAS